jgi:hypothetical protein
MTIQGDNKDLYVVNFKRMSIVTCIVYELEEWMLNFRVPLVFGDT